MADNDNIYDPGAIDAEIASMMDDFGKPGEPFDYAGMADRTAAEIDKGGPLALDPPDPVYWREVVAELRRRWMRQSGGGA